jgi:proline iminopeptidase
MTESQPPSHPRPFDARMLNVGDGHWIYVEEVGTRDGRPVVFLHGGPGSGAQGYHRGLFDLERDHVFLIDQRGAGRSHPHLSLHANTTQHLIADIEHVREHFSIDRWLVTGGSWGSTLALAYAQAHPERVNGLVLRAIFLGTDEEVEWAFVKTPQTLRPDLYADFIRHLDKDEQSNPLAAYWQRLSAEPGPTRTAAAHTFAAYERILSEIKPSTTRITEKPSDGVRLPPTPLFIAHYAQNHFFLTPNQLLADAERLAGIPMHIIQGRYDLLCPPKAAFELHSACPSSTLQIVDGAGHALTDPGMFAAMKAAITRLQLSRPSCS